ncbi:FAD binding domain-containing protein [Devosia rhizoryzae]|uniref:Xanthine dehydrogenase family protein subunit M n=1 Tax=Devosia rhizoryzae TaxID=2774137 RepID=A0ABX7C5M9_9HYPH|nr:xanthine dehydrogenase family protein subunit M [Devosia rhizoryzae]QQR38052.1 xanthine dehydrogenase family protein subunit M [Devosia rhizoryzae]
MMRFSYSRPQTVAQAAASLVADPSAQIIAGGTNLVDLMKYDVTRPGTVIDINGLDLRDIRVDGEGTLQLGALATNADTAYHPEVQSGWPLLSSAMLAAASPQLRNAATNGGNILQRTRCYYFYDPSTPCNKRRPGSGCGALHGVNRIHAILGESANCIAVHPSDMAVALAALDAVVTVEGPAGERQIPFDDFHRLPGDRPDLDNTMERGEIVTAISVPANGFGSHHTYLKLRDRQSYAFALVSVAAAIRLEGETIAELRVALGGVAHKPWRRKDVEAEFIGRPANRPTFEAFAQALMEGATGHGHNDFKLDLAPRAIVRALEQAHAGTPQNQAVKVVF